MKSIAAIFAVFFSLSVGAQGTDSTRAFPAADMADRLFAGHGKLVFGGYGEVHYNQPLSSEEKSVGSLDVHRFVLLTGYSFSPRTRFMGEIEFEHVSEVFIEQAYLEHRLNRIIRLRAGLILIPMGIMNENHEPVTFNGVERTQVDTRIVPTTWREIGAGATGTLLPLSVRYQVYVVNGFNGYDGTARLNGQNGFRGGRQKGAESYISSPNVAARVEFFGMKGLTLGLSGYSGKTQSRLYQGINRNDPSARARADSSVVHLTMGGIDARYSRKGIEMRGQYILASIAHTGPYNAFTSSGSTANDLGSRMHGYFLEAGYDILKPFTAKETRMVWFGRYEEYNTHLKTSGNLRANPAYHQMIITAGLSLHLASGAVFKTDIQFSRQEGTSEYTKVFQAGIGFMF